MSKLELSINADYLPSWRAWEGIRELVQNGKDAETEFDAPLKITHHNQTLRIENEGAELSREALLFGTTSKVGRDDMIGRFGEGLKLGVLALVRSGRQVKIRTGSEVWTASIARSERYAADVLCFEIKGGNEDKKRVRVEINGVSDRDWNDLKDRFLFLDKLKDGERVETDRGDLLLADRFAGRIFVKGIFVQDDHRLGSGYNFLRADVDRDRAMVRSWDLQYEAGAIWALAVAKRPDLLDPFFKMLLDGKADVEGVEHIAHHVGEGLQKQVADAFATKFGANSLPVATLAESAEIEHFGKRGVVVPRALGAMLETTLGSKEEQRKKLSEEVVRTLSWSDLDAAQQGNIHRAISMISGVRPECTLELIDIVEFRSAGLLGQYKADRILVAARICADFYELLATLVHEFAHHAGLGLLIAHG